MIAAPAAGAATAASSLGLCSMCSMLCSACTSLCVACTWAKSCVQCCSGGMCASKEKGGWSAGKVGSLMVMINGVGLALMMQYVFGEHLRGSTYMHGECSKDGGGGYEHACLAQQGVFRVSFALCVFFLICTLGCRMSRQFHEALWALKLILLFLPLLMIALFWIPAVWIEVYVWIARCGAAIFVVLQCIVIIDLSYAINDWFVAQSNAEYNALAAAYDASDGGLFSRFYASSGCSSLDEALTTLLAIAVFLYAAALTGIILLFVYFSACSTTTAFVAMTLVLCVAITIVQLAVSENGNLLTSASVCAYSVFIAYTAVTRDPSSTCNPFLQSRDILGIILGLGLSLLSLGWTTHASTTAVADVLADDSNGHHELGSALNTSDADDDDTENPSTSSGLPPAPLECLDGGDSDNVRFNLVLSLVACYIGCVLTNWGTWQNTTSDISNPLAGRVSSWLNIGAQWIMFILYLWTLLAPLIFPDRDFA